MKITAYIYLVLTGICGFLHYPLAVISPYGLQSDGIQLVFNYEFPHIFIASFISTAFIFLNLDKFNLNGKAQKIIPGALGLIVLSGLIYQVPIYRIFETAAFFTVPIGVFLAVKVTQNSFPLVAVITLIFIVNLGFCLLISGNNKIGIAGNQNWLAATLISGFPFLLIALKKLPQKVFYAISVLICILTVIVFIRTSARALIPAVGVFALYFLYQRKSIKVNVAVWIVILALGCAGVAWKFDKVKRGFAQDIRGPLYMDTVGLIVSTPLLGTGPGNFQKDFPEHASDTLKKRIYYSSIVEHPHNEFLNLAASNGVIVAGIWLFFLFILLKKRDDTEGVLLQFSVLTAFIMGMADKPLTESPSAIIFLCACGLLMPDKFYQSEQRGSVKNMRVAGGVFAVIVLVFGIYRTQIDIRSRYHFWKGEDFRLRMGRYNRSEIINQAFTHYAKSSNIDPTFINAAYNAASFSIYFYSSLSQDQKLLEHMISLEPDYSDFNLKIAQYYMKQARLLGEGDEKEETENVAESFYLRNYELSPWNINRSRWLVRFYLETEQFDKAEEWILKTREITRERMVTRYTHTDKVDLLGDLEKWLNTLLNSDDAPVNIDGAMKDNDSGDYLEFKLFERTNFLANYPAKPIYELDRQFWSRRVRLWEKVKSRGIKSVKDIMNLMVSLNVKDEPAEWPLKVLESGDGNARTLASLACSINSFFERESVILNGPKGEIISTLFEGDNAFLWNCKTDTLMEMTIGEFLKSPFMGEGYQYELFCYPEAFCLRNQVNADIASMHPDIPLICQSPTLDKIRLQRILGKVNISYSNYYIPLLDSAALKAK